MKKWLPAIALLFFFSCTQEEEKPLKTSTLQGTPIQVPQTIETANQPLSIYNETMFGEYEKVDPSCACITEAQLLPYMTSEKPMKQHNLFENYRTKTAITDTSCLGAEGPYRICPVGHFTSDAKRYIILKEYEQISANNGSSWTFWLMEISPEDELQRLVEIGNEACYKHTDNSNTQVSSLVNEAWSYTTTSIQIDKDSLISTITERYVERINEQTAEQITDTLIRSEPEVNHIAIKL